MYTVWLSAPEKAFEMTWLLPEEQEHIARAVLDFIDSRDGKHPLVPWRVMLSRQDAVPVDLGPDIAAKPRKL